MQSLSIQSSPDFPGNFAFIAERRFSVAREDLYAVMHGLSMPVKHRGMVFLGQFTKVEIFGICSSQSILCYMLELILNAATASNFTLLGLGSAVVQMGDKHILTIREGARSVSFGLKANFDISAGSTHSLSAQLIDADLIPTHGQHNEASIAFEIIAEFGFGETSRDIIGDFEAIDFDPVEPGIQAHFDDLGNPILDLTKPKAQADNLFGSDGNDHFVSAEEDDHISAKEGDDLIEAGAGNDMVTAAQGNDHILGGAGRDSISAGEGADLIEGGVVGGEFDTVGGDILIGSGGDDQLFGELKISIEDAIAGLGDATNQKGDWENGAAGDDIIVGSLGNDVLTGGGGEDLLIGGAGDDNILGDPDWNALTVVTEAEFDPFFGFGVRPKPTFNWFFTDTEDERIFEPVVGETEPADSAADTIYAGAGNDWVRGDGGDDVVFGDAGDDNVGGGEGADTLFGGEGNDLLFGDAGSEDLEPALHGNDYLDGGTGDDILVGSAGDDLLFGDEGDDQLFGDSSDLPESAFGDDFLDGEAGNDQLVGYGGDDYAVSRSLSEFLCEGSHMTIMSFYRKDSYDNARQSHPGQAAGRGQSL